MWMTHDLKLSDSLVARPSRQQEGLPEQCRVALLCLKKAYSDRALNAPDERSRSTTLLKRRQALHCFPTILKQSYLDLSVGSLS